MSSSNKTDSRFFLQGSMHTGDLQLSQQKSRAITHWLPSILSLRGVLLLVGLFQFLGIREEHLQFFVHPPLRCFSKGWPSKSELLALTTLVGGPFATILLTKRTATILLTKRTIHDLSDLNETSVHNTCELQRAKTKPGKRTLRTQNISEPSGADREVRRAWRCALTVSSMESLAFR